MLWTIVMGPFIFHHYRYLVLKAPEDRRYCDRPTETQSMVFARLRQGLASSPTDFQGKFNQLKETFPDEQPEKLKRVLKDAKGDYSKAVRSLNGQNQARNGPTQTGPRKLQRPAQYDDSNPNLGIDNAVMHKNNLHTVPFPSSGNELYSGPAPQQHHQPAFASFAPQARYVGPSHLQPAFPIVQSQFGYMGPPQKYHAPPICTRSEPPTSVIQNLREFPAAPMPVPPYP